MIKEFQGEYRFLSNFWPAPVEYDKVIYPSTENAYQAAKTRYYEDRLQFETCAPNVAKKLGKRLKIRSDWDDIRLEVMFHLNWQKFSNHPELKEKLLATGDQEIQEGNKWHDTYWGVDLETGKGRNHLGIILMLIREKLKE